MEKIEGPVLSLEQLDEMMQNGQLIELMNGGKQCVIPESYDVTKERFFTFLNNWHFDLDFVALIWASDSIPQLNDIISFDF